jgi:hypothetical protein
LLRIHWRALRPSKPPSKKERLCEANRRASLAFSGRALAPLPHPPRASTKTRTLLWMVEVGLAFESEIRAVLDRAERPQGRTDELPDWPRPSPIRSGVCTAVGPRVINPAFFALPTASVGPEKVELCAAFLSGEQWNNQPTFGVPFQAADLIAATEAEGREADPRTRCKPCLRSVV